MRSLPTSHTRAVLFDLDGTLLDTAPDLAGALNELRAAAGLEPLPLDLIRQNISSGATELVRLAFLDATAAEHATLRARFLDSYRSRLTRETRPYEGVFDALAHLESAGIPWGIVTNKLRIFAEPLLEAFGLGARAGVIVYGDSLSERKPHPAPLLHAANVLDVTVERCTYIGDSESDVLAARAAGMTVFVALFGYIPANEQPRAWPANGWLAAPSALVALIESIAQGTSIEGASIE